MSLTTIWSLLLVVTLAVAAGYSAGTYIIASTVLWIAYVVVSVVLLIASICNDVANARAAVHHLPEESWRQPSRIPLSVGPTWTSPACAR